MPENYGAETEEALALILAMTIMMIERVFMLRFAAFLAVGRRAQRMLMHDAAAIPGRSSRLRGLFAHLWPHVWVWAVVYYLLCLGLVSSHSFCTLRWCPAAREHPRGPALLIEQRQAQPQSWCQGVSSRAQGELSNQHRGMPVFAFQNAGGAYAPKPMHAYSNIPAGACTASSL